MFRAKKSHINSIAKKYIIYKNIAIILSIVIKL